MVALGVTWSWVIILVGLAVGAILAVVAVVGDLPMALLTILTALAGASAAVTGLMLIFGVISLQDFDSVATTERLDDDWWWYVIFGALVFAGMIVQIRTLRNLRASLREAWVESGGGQLRRNPI
jgi:NAD/NADP transhydrogenase beta subunit